MEMLCIVLSILGVSCSMSAVILSLRDIILKEKAKRKLAVILMNDPEYLNLINDKFDTKYLIETNEKLEDYENLIKRGLKFLSENDKRYIEEGFYQPSEQGRKAYIKTIFSELSPKEVAA